MIPFLLITKNEFIKLITFKYSLKRYIFAFAWYIFLGCFIYLNTYLHNHTFITYEKVNVFVFLVLFIFLTRGILMKIPKKSNLKMDEEFKNKIAIIIACHNSQDVLPSTLKAALKHFSPDAIYIADNNKIIPDNNISKEICEKHGVNYIYTQVSNKTKALRNTVKFIDPKFKYLISMDDDTLFPEEFYINENVWDDDKVGCIAFGIRIKNKQNLIERCVDLEYKLYSYNSYGRNFGSLDFGIGIAYMMKTDIFKKCIDINPADGRLPYGEDGYQGVACRHNGYILLQDLNNFFLTYCPDKLVSLSCNQKSISGYDAGSLWKQRPLRWYRTGTARLILEFTTVFTFNASRNNENIFWGILRNIYYRFWKILEFIMIIVIINFPFIIYNNIKNPKDFYDFLFITALFPLVLLINLAFCKFKFRNNNDLYIDYTMVFIYPLFMKLKFLLNVFGFLSCITFFVPFETYWGFYNINNYKFKKENKNEDIELGEIIIK